MSMSTPFEVEQKFSLHGRADQVLARLTEVGATFSGEIRQIDRYFNHPVRDFAQTDEALRIRSVGDCNFVTWKGPKIDSRTKTRREIETPLGDGEQTAEQFGETLERLGFRPVAVVSKQRQQLELTRDGFHFELVMDEVDQVGSFMEIELLADEAGLAEAQAAVLKLSAELGLDTPERRSYLEMLLETTDQAGQH